MALRKRSRSRIALVLSTEDSSMSCFRFISTPASSADSLVPDDDEEEEEDEEEKEEDEEDEEEEEDCCVLGVRMTRS